MTSEPFLDNVILDITKLSACAYILPTLIILIQKQEKKKFDKLLNKKKSLLQEELRAEAIPCDFTTVIKGLMNFCKNQELK